MSSSEDRRQAVLLLGPTGSGKTPLGDLLEHRGWQGRKCLHFDFGANLRRIVDADTPGHGITDEDIDFLCRVLDSGALLENEHFPLAHRVLNAFLASRQDAPAGQGRRPALIVLNGLPRHVGQAEAVDGFAEVLTVICLRCGETDVAARIRSNVGGDRAGRGDDDMEAIRHKLRVFNDRTRPLLSYYRSRGVPIETIEIGTETTPQDAWEHVTRGGFKKQWRGGPKREAKGQ